MRIRYLRGRVLTGLGVVLVALPVVTIAGSAVAAPVPPDPAGAPGVRQPVIVVLADQHDADPPTASGAARRRALAEADQRPLVEQARLAGATDVRQFSVVNGFAATMTAAEQDRLAADPRVRAVVPDRQMRTAPRRVATGARTRATAAGAAPVCPSDPAKPLLEPEALTLTRAVEAQSLATGRGVKVGFVADGLDIDNPDLVRADGSRVVVDFQDFSGDGTLAPSDGREAFGDASAIAAQGRQTYDLAEFVNPASPLPRGCTIRILGVAPGASLVALRFTTIATAIRAIDYAVTVAKVDVLDESFGNNPVPDRHNDPLSLANHAAVAAGVTVVAASGDAGVNGTVGNPAGDPAVISVGAATSFRLFAQIERNIPGFTGGFTSGNVASISSGGSTEGATVDDLMAPGDEGWALCSTDTARFTGCLNSRDEPSPIENFGGTSQAAPFVAGAAALVVEAYAKTHGGAKPRPDLVKRILNSTAADQNDPADRQGAGLLDCLHAVQAALSTRDSTGAPPARGDNLLVEQTQLAATAGAGILQKLPLTVTNVGSRPQTVTAHTRVLNRVVFDQTGRVDLDGTAPRVPTWIDGFGVARAFVTRRFTVPPGVDHLVASIVFTPNAGRQVRLRLLDPGGGLAASTDPQGPGGFGQADVHAPVPGTWTAIFDTRATSDGFHGTVAFDLRGLAYSRLGTVVPASLTLQPGQRATFRVAVATPEQPGDLSAAVQLDTDRDRRVAVPLTLRSLIPTTGGHGRFTGTLTGGNGRDGAPAQQIFYRFDVPAGLRDFGLNLTLSGDPDQFVFGMLETPDGQLLSQQTNVEGFDAQDNPIFGQTLQEFRRNPVAGRWTFVVFVQNPVAGTTTAQRFSGEVRFNAVDVHASGLPNSRGTVLPAGRPVTARVTVHNTGIAPESFFADPRTTGRTDLRLVPDKPETGVPVPQLLFINYQLPTECTRITNSATATAPIDVELQSITEEPEVIVHFDGTHPAAASVRAPQVTPGPWRIFASLVGPFPPQGSPGATADFATTGHCRGFDPAVSSSTGDVWLAAVQAEPPPFTPLVLQPGQTGTITVTFTPSAPRGTVVTGMLLVDDFNDAAETGDELTAIPYTYTVG